MYEGLLHATGCAGVDCLLAMSTDDLFHAKVPISDSNVYLSPYVPTADGVEMTTHPWLSAADGDIADVPIVHGTNSDEGILFTSLEQRYRVNMTELTTYWSEVRYYSDEEIAELTALYVVGHADDYPVSGHDTITSTEWWALQRSWGDDMMSCPAEYLSQQLSLPRVLNPRSSPTYMYHFEYASLVSSYTVHGAELPFVFHWRLGDFSNDEVADVMSSYWGNFVIDSAHSPNSEMVGLSGLPKWPEYSAAADKLLVLSTIDAIHVESKLKQNQCRFHISKIDAAIRAEFA
jgi:acetylcholinesterase